MASSVLSRMALALPVLRIDIFAMVMPTYSAECYSNSYFWIIVHAFIMADFTC